MSSVNVLSDSLKIGGKLDKTSSLTGKNAADSLEKATTDFAAMLGGLTTISADPIGQNPKIAQDLEDGQNPDSFGQNLGYVHFALAFLAQPIVLSDLPAGKEANSGNGVNQGTGEGLSAADNQSLGALNKLSLDINEVFSTQDMTTQIPQKNNPGITELDKYRQVIADLLVALSGQITDSSPEGASLVLGRGISERQEIMKLMQGWLTVTDDLVNNVQAASGQIMSEQSSNGQAVGNLAGDKPLLGVNLEAVEDEAQSKIINTISSGKGVEDLRQAILRTVQDWMKGTDEAAFSTQITDSSIVGATLDLDRGTKMVNPIASGRGVEDLRQLIATTVQDWLKRMDGVAKNEPNSSVQTIIKPLLDFLSTEQGNGGKELNTKAASLLVVLNQILSQVQEKSVPPGVIKEMLAAKGGGIETLFSQQKSSSLVAETAVTAVTTETAGKSSLFKFNSKQKLAQMDLQQSNPLLKNVQGDTGEEIAKGVIAESAELSGVKTSQNQSQSLGIGAVGNTVMGNVTDGKTVAIPVWEQISNVLREQLTNRHTELKELDIKLHPADLGRIQIGLRWENGQVHLQVYASEAATGQVLQNQLSELRHTLTSQGVNCGTLQMGQHGGDQQQNRQGNESQRTLDLNTNLSEDEEAIPGINPFSPGPDGNNRLNVTA
ncbi:flagellar hook-length control protein FliK [Desulfosporosinus sp. BICA1-9]|uniref:flagellar hook-length control protein FliK n=1 Tax=Desulfosporosinus sp. BICA1-9 TaxID=1531958 RepID=UPI00054B8D64|nr:flagellar hook-length control protein FliK [Desulfosporosinus sp. BICA1-9]KJS47194.1 MAG: hypothetical protein VR66_21050 [Peptococcaceae bacterium BRH_c23]KJS90006.1 MAG: hypothetical protein JL57_04050 [Desulfosporosinus sp. BICA1-9]HBW36414.1 flagellar hook-length control protein FliK [Desulfosporosinus sp.]